ncbi:hypothetical protein HK101_008716 [Irineochytrium annulatum]|nr:hypothetical protein HK101_008716 [Irineochytrium annulatum]
MDTTTSSKRAAKLQYSLKAALKSTLDRLSKRNLKSSFPQLAKSIPDQLEVAREQTIEFIQQAATCSVLIVKSQEEFQIIISQRQILEKLQALDEIINNSARPGEPHQWAGPEVAVRSRVVALKTDGLQKDLLELKMVTDENERLYADLLRKRSEKESSHSIIAGRCAVMRRSLYDSENNTSALPL